MRVSNRRRDRRAASASPGPGAKSRTETDIFGPIAAHLLTRPLAESVTGLETPTDEVVDQIRRLCELRDAGLVTAQQFLLRRARILGRPYR